MVTYKKNGKPTHRKERTVNSDFDIIAQYQSEFRGFVQYYLLAYNAHQLHGLKRTMELSLAHTLANNSIKRRLIKSSSATKQLVKQTEKYTKYFKRK